MLVGKPKPQQRAYFAHIADRFAGATVVVGGSGAFAVEALLTQHATPAAIHGGDQTLPSWLLGRWLTGQSLDVTLADAGYEWLEPYFDGGVQQVAAILETLRMLPFDRKRHATETLRWDQYRLQFPELVAQAVDRLQAAKPQVRLDAYYNGDIASQFAAAPADAIFYVERPASPPDRRTLERANEVFRWPAPAAAPLTDQRADALFDWLQHAGRRWLWVETDREQAGHAPACVIETGTSTIKTTRLFTNLVDAPAFWRRAGTTDDLPALPLAGRDLRLTKKSVCQLAPLKTSVIAAYKDHFLKRSIRHSPGMWGYAVCLDGQIVGFLEFASSSYGAADELYLQSDFSFETHPYLRMSKLVLALAKAGETRRLLEKKTQRRVRSLCTTAFTDKPVSMKYRGVFEIAKRGVTRSGTPFINYAAPFDEQSWRAVYRDWFFKHAGALRQELPA